LLTSLLINRHQREFIISSLRYSGRTTLYPSYPNKEPNNNTMSYSMRRKNVGKHARRKSHSLPDTARKWFFRK
jgi:hypothetical protein